MGYTASDLVTRIKGKAWTSTSSSLSDQSILDYANDSLRSYLVPLSQRLREEWWICPTDLVYQLDSNGGITIPDSVSSTLRTVAWLNGSYLSPLTRIEPENSFNYLPQVGALPIGFELRGYRLQVLPVCPGATIHITAAIRPPEMVLSQNAGQVASVVGSALTLVSVPLEWQSAAPAAVDIVSAVSPFSTLGTFPVVSLVGSVLTVTGTPPAGNIWAADVGYSPFPNVPIELHPLLQQDVIVQLYVGLGDKRLDGAAKRKAELEKAALGSMAPRTVGNARAIVNYSAPGMNSMRGWWGRR